MLSFDDEQNRRNKAKKRKGFRIRTIVGRGGVTIRFPSVTLPESATNNDVVGTALIHGTATGTAVFSLSVNVGTKFKINSSTGQVQVNGTTPFDYETATHKEFTISVAGLTPSPPDLPVSIGISNVTEDTTPTDNFSFTDLVDRARSTLFTAGPFTVAGVDGPSTFRVTGTGAGKEYQINGGAWTGAATLGSVVNGDVWSVRFTSDASYSTATTLIAAIGGNVTSAVTHTWTITTLADGSAAPDAPSIALTSQTGNDSTWNVTLPTGLSPSYRNEAVGDIVEFELSVDGGAYSVFATSDPLTSIQISGSLVPITTPSLPDGSLLFRARTRRTSPLVNSLYSGAASLTIDTTPPSLSSPSGAQLLQSTAGLHVTTNETGGTLYWVVTTSASAPTNLQVVAGTGATGQLSAGNAAVSSSGAQSVTGTSVSVGTRYAYFCHVDGAGNKSSVATATWTQADITGPSLTSPGHSAVTQTTLTATITTDEATGSLYIIMTANGTTPTAAQIQAGHDAANAAVTFDNHSSPQSISSTGAKNISVTGGTAAAAYHLWWVHVDAASNPSNIGHDTVTMAAISGISPVFHISAAQLNTPTTAPIDSTGADFIAITTAIYQAFTLASPPFDNMGNTYTNDAADTGPETNLITWHCIAPVVGPGHVFKLNASNQAGGLCVTGFSGVNATQGTIQVVHGRTVSVVTTVNAGPVTPTVDGCLLIMSIAPGDNDGTLSITLGATITDSFVSVSGQYIPFGQAYLILGAGTAGNAINPVWSWTHNGAGGGDGIVGTMVIKPA